ncbi:ABC transporter permease [Mollicutes bacterium LVI A0039]|nr:ABC transporter permease [Mollicutes bacterium LVI A0039]
MYDLKNSSKNVIRNIKRYTIVGILIFIISFISVIALIVNQSSESTIEYYLEKYGNTATIDLDPEQMSMNFSKNDGGQSTGGPMSITPIDFETYQDFADSSYVESVSYQQMTMVSNEDLKVNDDNEQTTNQPDNKMMVQGSNGMQMDGNMFSLIGSDDFSTSSYFKDNANILVEGDMPSADGDVLISTDLASYNDLAVGDTVAFNDMLEGNEVQLTISGLYTAATSEQMMMGMQNNIFTNYNTVSQFTEEMTNITATYTLTSYAVASDFEQELYDKGLDEMYYVNNNITLLNQITGPVETTMGMLSNLLIIVFITGGAILIFINLLILRERKYEIGVLRALGMKTRQVTKGLIYEMIIVTTVAMLLATVVGTVFAQPISDSLIASNNVSQEMTPMKSSGNGPTMIRGGMMEQTTEETITTIETKIDFKVLLITLAINMILVLITTFVASGFINRQHPNEILREQ